MPYTSLMLPAFVVPLLSLMSGRGHPLKNLSVYEENGRQKCLLVPNVGPGSCD